MRSLWQTQSLVQGDLTLVCLPGVGGRLWDVLYQGKSLFFQNEDLLGKPVVLDALDKLPTRSPQFGFPLWGGEKTWVAPDRDWPNGAPHIMLDSAPYQVIAADPALIHLQSEICPESGLRIDREISIGSPDSNTDCYCNSWTIQHTLQNCGRADKFAGIWSVLMLPHSGVIGLHTLDTQGIRGAEQITAVFGSAAGLVESHIVSDGNNVIINCPHRQEFKVGLDNSQGRVIIRLSDPDKADKSLWLRCQTAAPATSDCFAHQHNFEVFNSGDYPYYEAEWHSPAKTLAPGDYIQFQQHFTVGTQAMMFPTDSKSLTESITEKELLACMS